MQLPAEALPWLAAAAALFGLLNCLYGFRLFKLMLALAGFAGAGLLAGGLSYAWTEGNAGVAVAAGMIGGLIGAVLLFSLYYLGVFFFGACLGMLLAASVTSATVGLAPPAALIIGGVLGGVAALLLQRLMIVLATAFSGAASLVLAGLFFLERPLFDRLFARPEALAREHLLWLLAWAVLGAAGAGVQLAVTARKRAEDDGEKAKQDEADKMYPGLPPDARPPPHTPHPDPVPSYVPAYNEPSFSDPELDQDAEPTEEELDAALAEAEEEDEKI